MQNVSDHTVLKVSDLLSHKKHQLEVKLGLLEAEEREVDSAIPQPFELGAHSWHADVQANRAALKYELKQILIRVDETLGRIKSGTYGICNTCGKQIEAARLGLVPTAYLCITCK